MILRGLVALVAAVVGIGAQVIEFTAPSAGQRAALSDGHLHVQWSGDSGELVQYRLQLMAGGDTEASSGQVGAIEGTPPRSRGEAAISLPLQAASGPAAVNAYYLRMAATRENGQTMVFYSSRFSIAGMTGVFPGSASGQSANEVQAAYEKVQYDVAAVPSNQAVEARQVGANGDVPPYSMQTAGDIKYAPMQQQPPTSITADNTAPLYPTTAYNLARSALPLPTFVHTQTQAVTYKTSSIVNPATAAPQPQDDMAKYLARWKD